MSNFLLSYFTLMTTVELMIRDDLGAGVGEIGNERKSSLTDSTDGVDVKLSTPSVESCFFPSRCSHD